MFLFSTPIQCTARKQHQYKRKKISEFSVDDILSVQKSPMNKEPKNSLEVIQCDYNFQGQNLKVHFGLMKYMFLKIFSLFSGEHNKQKKQWS